VAVLVAPVLLACVGGCSTVVAGQPRGEKGVNNVGYGKQPDDYTFPDNNSGFAKGEIDQPAPVPGFNWEHWPMPASHCAWVPAHLFDGIASAAPQATGHFCSFYTVEGNTIQITWGGLLGPFDFDRVDFIEPATVAGLQARVYDLHVDQVDYPGACQVGVATRAISSFSVLNWNEQKKPLDRTQSCQTAKQVAERIAKAMVPLAGGQVWAGTPQKPDPAVVGTEACKVVNDIVTTYAVIEVGDKGHIEGRNDLGATCTAKTDSRKSEALLTKGPGQGLAEIPPPTDAQVTSRKIGQLPARQEIVDRTCAFAVEFAPGRLLRIQYSDTINDGSGCLYARAMVMIAVQGMLDKTPR
jgi:hypothetical protein